MVLFLEIISQVTLWLCLATSVGIMIPQVIVLHRNKYADNSSVWTYWIYFYCNLIWTIYQVLFIVWRSKFYEIDHAEPPKGLELILLYIQLSSDIITSLLGIYLVIVKYYYLHILKKTGKNQLIENEILQKKKDLQFVKNNIYLIDQQYTNICKHIHQFIKKSCSKSNQKDTIIKLLKISKKVFKNINNKVVLKIYETNNKLLNKFIDNYKKVYLKKYKQITSTIKIKNTNLTNLSYQIKLRIAFVIITNLTFC